MKRTAFVAVLMLAAVSLETGCFLWPWHRRTSVTASDVHRPNTGAPAVGASQH